MNNINLTIRLGISQLYEPKQVPPWKIKALLCHLFLLFMAVTNVMAQDDVKYKVIDKEDDSKGVCWPLVQTALTEATTNEMETDTTSFPGASAAGLATPRKLYNAVEVPNVFTPNPTIQIFDLVGNPLIINGTTITFSQSLVAASIAADSLGTTPGFHWVGYESNLFQPDRVSTYYYNIFHRWFSGLPSNYHNFGGRQFNFDNTGTANVADTTFDAHPISVSILQGISCFGSNDGALKTNTSPINTYSYSIDGNPSVATGIFSGLTPGAHTVQIIDAFNNIYDTVINLSQPASISSFTAVTSCGAYTWGASALTYPASGIYTSTTLVGGCIKRDTLSLTVTASTTQQIFVTANNFYNWGLSGVTYTSSGNYFFNATTASGCNTNYVLHLTIINTPNNLVLMKDQEISCFGANDGSLQATAFPLGLTYTYFLDGGAQVNNTGYFIGLSAGVHTVCVSQGAATFTCETITFTNPDPLTINITADSLVSCQGNDGGLSAIITGGTTINQPYEAQWKNASNVLLNPAPANFNTYVTGLPAGMYFLRIEDDNGCVLTATKLLNAAPALQVQVSYSPIKCNGGSTTLKFMATGGIGEKTFAVNAAPPLPFYSAGTYTVSVTDSKGCIATTVITIANPLPLSVNNIATSCESYRWSMNGAIYTSSGIYLATITTLSGCPIACTLNLTINHASSSFINANACVSYNWGVPNASNPYTASGLYTVTSLNASGCLRTDSLLLNINPITTSIKIASACNSYNWIAPGATNPYTASGTYTASSVNVAGCIQIDTLFLTIHPSSNITLPVITNMPYTWPLNGTTYTSSGTYTATYNNANGCLSTATLLLTINTGATSGVHVLPRILLDGPYDASLGLMHDSLRVKGIIPLIEPYSGPPFFRPAIGGGGGEATNNAVLSHTGPDAIVDWVHLELRTMNAPYGLVATKNALIQRDGDVVSAQNGISPLYFPSLPQGYYYICIKHRNHLGVMTSSPFYLQYSSQVLDFSNATPVFIKPGVTNLPRKVVGNVRTLWAGDANSNKNVKYNGTTNDRISILESVGINTPNNTQYGYRIEDVNMDGKVKYNNLDNDKNFILNNTVGSTTPNVVISQHTPN